MRTRATIGSGGHVTGFHFPRLLTLASLERLLVGLDGVTDLQRNVHGQGGALYFAYRGQTYVVYLESSDPKREYWLGLLDSAHCDGGVTQIMQAFDASPSPLRRELGWLVLLAAVPIAMHFLGWTNPVDYLKSRFKTDHEPPPLASAGKQPLIQEQVLVGIHLAAKYQAAIMDARAHGRDWSDINSDSLGMPRYPSATYVREIEVTFGGIAVLYGEAADHRLASRWLSIMPAIAPDGGVMWLCGYRRAPEGVQPLIHNHYDYTDVDPKYLPPECRGSIHLRPAVESG